MGRGIYSGGPNGRDCDTTVEGVVCRHGVPQELLSDRGGNFPSELMQEVCRLMGVKKLNTSGYHPQCNGLVERFNSTSIQMLAKVTKNPKDWDQCLPHVVYAYHTTAQKSMKDLSVVWERSADPYSGSFVSSKHSLHCLSQRLSIRTCY